MKMDDKKKDKGGKKNEKPEKPGGIMSGIFGMFNNKKGGNSEEKNEQLEYKVRLQCVTV